MKAKLQPVRLYCREGDQSPHQAQYTTASFTLAKNKSRYLQSTVGLILLGRDTGTLAWQADAARLGNSAASSLDLSCASIKSGLIESG